MSNNIKYAFVTGVSSGIGLEMTKKLLNEGYFVYGCSRTLPSELKNVKNFKYHKIDLSNLKDIGRNLDILFDNKPTKLDLVFLNAGLFGSSPNVASKTELSNFQNVLNVNLTANKVVMDYLINNKFLLDICIISASTAGVKIRAGMLSYATSKSALLTLFKIYALENPNIFFAVLGLCNMSTKLSKDAISGKNIELFPELTALKEKFKVPGYVSDPQDRATEIYSLLSNNIKSTITSGEFFDMRTLK